MLNIPESIKTLFKTDGVFKNFRVHFPNGENADLTNSDIVSESVKFTESICSKEVFQFGLSERSQIEFECVGVQNIYGMTIECAIEICVDSLGASWIADNQPSGTESFLDPQLCTYNGRNMYRVPYGRFIIESCPRSQGAMKHRRVTAYGKDYNSTIQLSGLTRKKLNYTSQTGNEFALNPYAFYAGERGDLSGLSYTEAAVSHYTSTNTNIRTYIGGVGSTNYYLVIEQIITSTYTVSEHPSSLYRATCEYDGAGWEWLKAHVPEGITIRRLAQEAFVPYLRWFAFQGDQYFPPDPTDTGIIYPYASNIGTQYGMDYTTSIKCHIEDQNNNIIASTRTFTPCTNISATRYDLTGIISSLVISFSPTFESDGQYRYFNAIDFAGIYNGFLEINAQFGTLGRDDVFKALNLSKSSPVSVLASDYSSLWWDEYDIAPIGSITATYYDKDISKEQTISYVFGNGESTYDMTDNYVLKHLSVSASDLTNQTIEEYVKELLDTYFIQSIQDIAFTPVDFEMTGLPYLEAGDYLEIDDADGGTVGTYIMTRTLSGIQMLADSIESKGGEVMGDGS